MWVEFVAGSRPAPGSLIFVPQLYKNQHIQIPIRPSGKSAKADLASSPNIVIYFFVSSESETNCARNFQLLVTCS